MVKTAFETAPKESAPCTTQRQHKTAIERKKKSRTNETKNKCVGSAQCGVGRVRRERARYVSVAVVCYGLWRVRGQELKSGKKKIHGPEIRIKKTNKRKYTVQRKE